MSSGSEKNNSKKQISAVLIALVVIVIAIFIGFNFKKIAAVLPLPIEIPESWKEDTTKKNEAENNNVKSNPTNDNVQSAASESTNDQNQEYLEKYLEWFFTADFPAFEEASKADNDCAIEFGIMQCVKSESNVEYKKNENDYTVIPAADVLSAARSLLPSIIITDKTVKDFIYDIKTQSYEVPAKAIVPKYMWFITSQKKTENNVVLTVAFYPYNVASTNKIPTDSPEKTMILTLQKDEKNYKIVSYVKK